VLLDNEIKQDKLEIDRIKAISEIEDANLDRQLQEINLRNTPDMGAVNGQQDINNQQPNGNGAVPDGVVTNQRGNVPTGIPTA